MEHKWCRWAVPGARVSSPSREPEVTNNDSLVPAQGPGITAAFNLKIRGADSQPFYTPGHCDTKLMDADGCAFSVCSPQPYA